MTWSPVNNQYDGVNSTPINDVEMNAPFYDWDFQYFILQPVILYAPLLTRDGGTTGGVDPDTGERVNTMRLMVVPPEKGRTC